ncbi:MAG: hypothetical protein HN353_04365, partial [Bdellovibrionales bacterium]|nr:hypothetical protein [Bdellovibrionales bacterium]
MNNFATIYRYTLVLLSVLVLLSLTACKEEKGLGINDEYAGLSTDTDNTAFKIITVKLENGNEFVVTGRKLDVITAVKIVDDTDADVATLAFNSKSATEFVAVATEALTFALGATYQMVITTASGDTSVPLVVYDLQDNSVAPANLESGPDGVANQFMMWDGTDWSVKTFAAAITQVVDANNEPIVDVDEGTGILFTNNGNALGIIENTGTINVDVGTEVNQIAQFDANNRYLIFPDISGDVRLVFEDGTDAFHIYNNGGDLQIGPENNTLLTIDSTTGVPKIGGVNLCLADGTNCAQVGDISVTSSQISPTNLSDNLVLSVTSGSGQVVNVDGPLQLTSLGGSNPNGASGLVLMSDANGNATWAPATSASSDSLGTHIATEDIKLGTNWIMNNVTGDVGIAATDTIAQITRTDTDEKGLRVRKDTSSGAKDGRVTIGDKNFTGDKTAHLSVDGAISAVTYFGSGANLTGISADNLNPASDTVLGAVKVGSGLQMGDVNDETLFHKTYGSALSDVNLADGNVLQTVSFDTDKLGHITAYTSKNLDSRYFTETESDNRFVNISGGETMTGSLSLPTDGLNVGTGELEVSGGNVSASGNINVGGDLATSGVIGASLPLVTAANTKIITTTWNAVERFSVDLEGDITTSGVLDIGSSSSDANTYDLLQVGNADGDKLTVRGDGFVSITSSTSIGGNLSVAGTINATIEGNSDTATALATSGTQCSTGESFVGVDELGNAQGCFDVGTQTELDLMLPFAGGLMTGSIDLGNNSLTSGVLSNITSVQVVGDILTSGNLDIGSSGTDNSSYDLLQVGNADGDKLTVRGDGFVSITSSTSIGGDLSVAGTINATIEGNSDTATALATSGTQCSTGESFVGVDESGNAQGCFDVATQGELDDLPLTSGGIVSSNFDFAGNSIDNVLGLKLRDGDTNTLELKAASMVSNLSLTFPGSAGGANQVLVNDGAGLLSWV